MNQADTNPPLFPASHQTSAPRRGKRGRVRETERGRENLNEVEQKTRSYIN